MLIRSIRIPIRTIRIPIWTIRIPIRTIRISIRRIRMIKCEVLSLSLFLSLSLIPS